MWVNNLSSRMSSYWPEVEPIAQLIQMEISMQGLKVCVSVMPRMKRAQDDISLGFHSSESKGEV